MARKEPPKPMFPLKHEFVDSLDNFINKAINLGQAAQNVIEFDCISNKAVAEQLRKHLEEFYIAMHGRK